MWKFWKFEGKKPKPEPRVLYIPEDQLAEFWQLWQTYVNVQTGKDCVERHQLWNFLGGLFPELKERDPKWRIKTQSALHPFLIEDLED